MSQPITFALIISIALIAVWLAFPSKQELPEPIEKEVFVITGDCVVNTDMVDIDWSVVEDSIKTGSVITVSPITRDGTIIYIDWNPSEETKSKLPVTFLR